MKDIYDMLDRIEWQSKLLEEISNRIRFADSNNDEEQVRIYGGIRYYLMKGFTKVEDEHDKED